MTLYRRYLCTLMDGETQVIGLASGGLFELSLQQRHHFVKIVGVSEDGEQDVLKDLTHKVPHLEDHPESLPLRGPNYSEGDPPLRSTCVYCGITLIGVPPGGIHRDGFGVGPEVPLCQVCYGPDLSCEEIWAKISQRKSYPITLQELLELPKDDDD